MKNLACIIIFVTLKILGYYNGLTYADENPIVTIADGQIQGKQNYTADANTTYYFFKGIPYAEPPVGDLRFKAPVKNSNWTGILNATEDKTQCTQDSSPVTGTEDCLYISVYTPSLTGNLSVMVWIYGGAFVGGNNSYEFFSPDYFLDEGVIFVSFNYRVGIFGFLSTGDEECSGNWALKDQILALQWVQNNIAYFGGNPNNVTAFGESAGAVSLSYLLQTNASKGLFQAAIMQSGTSLNLWGLNRRAVDIAYAVGTASGVDITSSTTLVEGLREINATSLQETATIQSTLITLENALEGIFFGPVIEPDYDGAVFTNYSEEMLSTGVFHRIPTIIGLNSNEAAAVGTIPAILRLYLLNYDVNTEYLAPADLTDIVLDSVLAAVNIKVHYFGLLAISLSSDATVKFISNDQFNRPIRQAVLDQSKYAPVYFYKFSYQGNLGGVDNRNFSGVGHGEDLGYLFYDYFSGVQPTANDTLIRQRFVRMWTNFAKYGNPTPYEDPLLQNITWEVAGSDSTNLKYLNITLNITVEANPFYEDMTFYDNIYSEYGSPPYNTY